MSVLVSKRRLSRHEALVYADELKIMMMEFCQRNCGIKNLKYLVRKKFIQGEYKESDFEFYYAKLIVYKRRIDDLTSLLTVELDAAYHSHPTTIQGYETKRDRQERGIACCYQLQKILEDLVTIYDVDFNTFARYSKAINREIDLIKDWRQRCNIEKRRILEKGHV